MPDQIGGKSSRNTAPTIDSDAIVVEFIRDAGAIARYLMREGERSCCVRCGDPDARLAALLSVPLGAERIEWGLCAPCLVEFPVRDTLYYKLL